MTKSNKILLGALTIIGCQLVMANYVLAGPMTGLYQLSNHPDGSEAPPLYGLRLDGLLDGNTNQEVTFDFNHASSDMKLTWDGSSINIFGTAWGGVDTGSSYGGSGDAAPRLWTIDYSYLAETFVDTGDGVKVENTSDGSGSANKGTITSDLGTWDMVDVGNDSFGYTFQFDTGHRGFSGMSGWGWLNHCESSTNAYGGDDRDCGGHIYSSDWLFTAEKIPEVPEPGTFLLLTLGLLGLGRLRAKFA